MPLFSRFKNKGAQPTSKGKHYDGANGSLAPPRPARWQSRWESTVVVPEEISELVHVCTAEMRSRAEALDAPFLLLPFRPESDPQGARTFIRNYYKSNADGSSQYRGEALKQELRLTDSVVLCSILKWCWSRMPCGVVSWPVYDGFRIGEREANLARNAFDTFIPIGVDSDARRSIIFDFFDLLAAVAAHGKLNGLTGRKLSRLAGWWAFDHSDDGKGFVGGYRSWSAAADASSHLFFAYLRSLSPDTDPSLNVIERIPRSLQSLVASTEYPPETPSLLQRSTPRVVMLVDSVSSTPFALLRRAKHFEYRDQDRILREFQEFEDPVDALTDECKRVLLAVSSANQNTAAKSRHGRAKPDESWTAFQNLGFADIDVAQKSPNSTSVNDSNRAIGQGLRDQPQSRSADAGRPTTPSWADFLSSGFADDGSAKSPTLLYPPAHVLPPLGSRSSSPGPLHGDDESLAPGELAAITNVELDDAFWWVWMISLAGEEPTERKGVFGRCALIETTIMNGRWLIMEEQVKGASPDPAEGAYIAPKKGLFSTFTKRGRLGRKRSASKNTLGQPERLLSATPSKTSISTDREAQIKAAARALTRKQETPEPDVTRRGRTEDMVATKTNSMLTIGLQSEATPAMKWASAYDKNTIRAQYLGDAYAGRGMSREELVRKASANTINENVNGAADKDRDLPRVPNEPILGPEIDFSKAQIAQSETVRQEIDPALDKEIGADPDASPESTRIGRKPVPRPAGHPAYRGEEQAHMASSPVQNAAALAAARAMQSSTTSTSPESTRKQSMLKKQPSTTGSSGIKKLFGKRKEVGGRDSMDGQRPNHSGLAGPQENSVSRRLSIMRKKAGQSASPRASEPALPEHTHAGPEYSAEEPVVAAADVHNHSTTDLSRSSTLDRQVADHDFSRFDQGPMDDMPAATPIDSPELASYQEHQVTDSSRLHSMSHEDQPSFDAPVSDGESEVTMEDLHDAQIVQDRWATIRDNAQRRAASHQQQPSEDQSTQSRFSHSQRTDDGETSGEETIESRVARIKARVAELTGNMDSAPRA